MAIALVASTSIGYPNGGSTTAIDTTGANCIILNVTSYSNNPLPTITDSKGNIYTILPDYTNPLIRQTIYYCLGATTGTGHTFTIAGTSTFVALVARAFSGVGHYVFQQNGAVGSASPLACGNVTPTVNGSLVITGISSDTLITDVVPTGFTGLISVPAVSGYNYQGSSSYLIQTTAATINPAWTWAGTKVAAVSVAVFSPINSGDVQYLIEAGGGGGGSGGGGYFGASGGGGGLRQGVFNLASGTYPVVVGAGGTYTNGTDAPGGKGGDSSINAVIATGGGLGSAGTTKGGDGGCGGGGSYGNGANHANGLGNTPATTPPQGYNGTHYNTVGGGQRGPGGGTSGPGTTAPGPGTLSNINGTSYIYGKGGWITAANTYGEGGAGGRTVGDGGPVGSAGAQGVVILAYPTGSIIATGGTITTIGDRTVHTFTSSGNFVVTSATAVQLSQLPVETAILSNVPITANIGQLPVEIALLVPPPTESRITQLVTELISLPTPNIRTTQLVTELISLPTPAIRVTQIVTEVISGAVVITTAGQLSQLPVEIGILSNAPITASISQLPVEVAVLAAIAPSVEKTNFFIIAG